MIQSMTYMVPETNSLCGVHLSFLLSGTCDTFQLPCDYKMDKQLRG